MLKIVTVDYQDPQQMTDLLMLLDLYAQDPMGGGEPLTAECRTRLPQTLQQCTSAVSLIAYQDDVPAGLLNAFQTVSTFAARPLINIHDLAYRAETMGGVQVAVS